MASRCCTPPSSGLGIAYLPSFLYYDAMERGLVEEAMPALPVDTQGIYAVYPPGRFTQPKVRAFIDFLVPQVRRQGPRYLVISVFLRRCQLGRGARHLAHSFTTAGV